MMEKLGQAKTHLELKKMISEVDTRNSGGFLCNANPDVSDRTDSLSNTRVSEKLLRSPYFSFSFL